MGRDRERGEREEVIDRSQVGQIRLAGSIYIIAIILSHSVILMAQGYTMYDFSNGVGRCILIDDSTHV